MVLLLDIIEDDMDIQIIAEQYWQQYCEILPGLVKYDCPKIILSNRLTKTAGYNKSWENTIILANKFLAKFERNMLTVILPHELAHQIDNNLNKWDSSRKHHDKYWKAIMIKIGQEPNIYHNMVL